jgi:hypothetical protein
VDGIARGRNRRVKEGGAVQAAGLDSTVPMMCWCEEKQNAWAVRTKDSLQWDRIDKAHSQFKKITLWRKH